jgi:hypothetical protein
MARQDRADLRKQRIEKYRETSDEKRYKPKKDEYM